MSEQTPKRDFGWAPEEESDYIIVGESAGGTGSDRRPHIAYQRPIKPNYSRSSGRRARHS